MHPYVLLAVAIVSEVVATSSLKLSDGMTKLWPSLVVVVGYALSFWLLSVTLKTLPIGFVYAVWTGIGVAAIAVIGVFWFEEPLSWGGVAGISMIIGGVAVLQISGSGAH
ncbi:multidrug efflux SMR transporter [Magnetovibrio sp. PR-2]|uniref:DMT family transporter n=1 Tax=Magnetovibrio sp. PR-2 TaxID=3120356 RepID=UPI002FCE6074